VAVCSAASSFPIRGTKLASRFGALCIRRLIAESSSGLLVLSGADVLSESGGLQHFRSLAQFGYRARARALLLALARGRLVLLVAIFVRHNVTLLSQLKLAAYLARSSSPYLCADYSAHFSLRILTQPGLPRAACRCGQEQFR